MAAIRTLLLDHSKQESQGSSGSTRNALQQVDLLAKAHEWFVEGAGVLFVELSTTVMFTGILDGSHRIEMRNGCGEFFVEHKGVSSHGLQQPHDPLMPGSLFVVSSVAECVWDSLGWPMPPAKPQKICSMCLCLLMHLLLHCITVHTPKRIPPHPFHKHSQTRLHVKTQVQT